MEELFKGGRMELRISNRLANRGRVESGAGAESLQRAKVMGWRMMGSGSEGLKI